MISLRELFKKGSVQRRLSLNTVLAPCFTWLAVWTGIINSIPTSKPVSTLYSLPWAYKFSVNRTTKYFKVTFIWWTQVVFTSYILLWPCFSLDDYNTEGSDASSIPDFSCDILAPRDSPTPFLCITDDNDVTHTPDSPGTPIHFIVRS